MNAGGYRVSPAEVEAALLAPSRRRRGGGGRARRSVPASPIIAAFYVPRPAPVPEAELAAHCARLLARYKCPRAFHAVGGPAARPQRQAAAAASCGRLPTEGRET